MTGSQRSLPENPAAISARAPSQAAGAAPCTVSQTACDLRTYPPPASSDRPSSRPHHRRNRSRAIATSGRSSNVKPTSVHYSGAASPGPAPVAHVGGTSLPRELHKMCKQRTLGEAPQLPRRIVVCYGHQLGERARPHAQRRGDLGLALATVSYTHLTL